MSTNEKQPIDENFYIEKERREFQEAKERNELGRQERHHGEQHGHRKYKMFTNHNSSKDQPTTHTGPGTI